MLPIETFLNNKGGNVLYKALAHPLAAERAAALIKMLERNGPVAIYDPDDAIRSFEAFHGLGDVSLAGYFVQKVEALGKSFRGREAQPVSHLGETACATLFIASFEPERHQNQLRGQIPDHAACVSFADIKLPEDMLTEPRRYLSPLNFATNFAFFRDGSDSHTRLVTANYWARYGAKNVSIWCRLFGGDGAAVASWREPCEVAGQSIVIDSGDIRSRFGLPPFTGQLFLHATGIAGHDIMKYVLVTYGDRPEVLSATHDANAWPSEFYAGLPAPREGESVILWLQNSHGRAIEPGEIGLSLMGTSRIARLDKRIGPFATLALDVSELFPRARWPAQFEVHAGKHVVRPRYEVVSAAGRSRVAHVNVERTDLEVDPSLPGLRDVLGKGYILPAPVLPPEQYVSLLLPTPMSTAQRALPVRILIYDAQGRQVAERRLGNVARDAQLAVNLTDLVGRLPGFAYGHAELVYDFDAGREADGWLHALFRYVERKSGHVAETSFGSHMFNSVVTYRSEPQSYSGPPPGLSTRLFVPVGGANVETRCHLIYPVSKRWKDHSQTTLNLVSGNGTQVAQTSLEVPSSGSRLVSMSEVFGSDMLSAAGPGSYVIVRDETCRLFGYQGMFSREGGSFSFDHTFGF